VKRLGGGVLYSHNVFHGMALHGEPSEPVWARNLLGDDFFHLVTSVGFGCTKFDDSDLSQLAQTEGMKRVPCLCLSDTRVTEGGLAYLRDLCVFAPHSMVQRLRWIPLVIDPGCGLLFGCVVLQGVRNVIDRFIGPAT